MNGTNHTQFPLGSILVSEEVKKAISSHEIERALARHARGDWGDFEVDEVLVNHICLEEDMDLISIFRNSKGGAFVVTTVGHRSYTYVRMCAEQPSN